MICPKMQQRTILTYVIAQLDHSERSTDERNDENDSIHGLRCFAAVVLCKMHPFREKSLCVYCHAMPCSRTYLMRQVKQTTVPTWTTIFHSRKAKLGGFALSNQPFVSTHANGRKITWLKRCCQGRYETCKRGFPYY